MAIQKFTLKSGTVLQVDMASFEISIGIVEAVKKAMRGADAQTDIGDTVAADAGVRKAVMAAFPWVIYGNDVMEEKLLNAPFTQEKTRGDFFEILRRIIEVNTHPFFQTSSLGSTPPGEPASSGQA